MVKELNEFGLHDATLFLHIFVTTSVILCFTQALETCRRPDTRPCDNKKLLLSMTLMGVSFRHRPTEAVTVLYQSLFHQP